MSSEVFVRVLINAAAGSVDDCEVLAGEIEAAFEDAGARAKVETIEPERIDDTIEAWWAEEPRPDAIGVAGGDGTVNGAVAVAAGTDIVLTVLPLGTFNHFAKDLGIPDDLTGAIRAIVDGEIRAVDVAEVDGEVFVNNSALGVYPAMVAIRDEIRESRGWGKIRAVPVACLRVLRDPPIHRLTIEGDDGFRRERIRTPFVFVGNGRYDNPDGGPIERGSLDDGVLNVMIARTTSRRRLLLAALRALVSGTRSVGEIDCVDSRRVTINGRTRHLRVARDGEIGRLLLPLTYTCRPGALRVLAPTAEDAGGQ